VRFRTRLLAMSLITLAIGLGALVVAGNVLLDLRVHSESSNLLRARADAQIAALDIRSAGIRVRDTPNDPTLDRRAWVLDGDRVIERPADAPPALDRLAVALGRRRAAGDHDAPGDVRLRVVPISAPGDDRPRGAVVVGQSTAPLETLQKEVLFGSFVIAGLILLGGAIALRIAIDRALRPVAVMTASAEDWGAHDLDRRFDLGAARDELTGLAATLDGLLSRIAASRRHEQRLAAEIAHELRTPLARLRLRAEVALAEEGDHAEAERREALRAVVDQTDRLTDTVETLLASARGELDARRGTTDLVALAAEIEDVEVRAPRGLPEAEGEPEILRRALAPLVENARRHARSRVTLELSAHDRHVRLAVIDDGPGLDPAIGEHAFEPGVGGGDGGAGLGLALARRLARSCGGDVLAEPGDGGRFVLELPAVPTSPAPRA